MSDWWIGRFLGDANSETAKRLLLDRRAIIFGIFRGAADPPRNPPSSPLNTNSPPRSPRPGPMSIKLSAARMISSSCSTTSKVLPLSRKLCITRTSRPTSRGCKPTLGSSMTKSVLTSDAPRQVVRLTRCISPPLSVRVERSSVR